MNTLIVFDSVFGNTEKIAQAIAEALNARALRVSDAPLKELGGINLLITASPTRAFRPTPAMSEWLKALPVNSLKGLRVAAFDTRISAEDIKPRLLRAMARRFGYAANPMLAALKRVGGSQAAAPEGFFVEDSEGPLKNGELQRAVTWAKALIN